MVTRIEDAAGTIVRAGNHHRMLSESFVVGLVMLLDSLLIVGGGLGIYYFYLDLQPDAITRYATVLAIAAIMMVQSFYIAGVYRFNAVIAPAQQIGKIISITTTVFLVLVAVAFALKISDQYSRIWLFSTAVTSVALIRLGRVGFVAVIRRLARKGYLARNILIYGATDQAKRFISQINSMNAPWNRIVGLFDDRHSSVRIDMDGIGVQGNLQDLMQYARDTRTDDIIIALPWGAQSRINELLQHLKVLPANIRLSPDLSSLRILSGTMNYQYGVPLASIYEKPMSAWHNVVKRVFDVCVSFTLLVVLAPIMLILFAGIKIDSPGPVFFRQRRYGFNNELIRIWKLRTMYVDQQDERAERLTTSNDPRVTRFGSFLRKTSLDELPQLFNVVLGDMSLVGPRPHALQAKAAGQLYQDAVGEYAARHRVRPGLTGWAQVNGWRGETDTHEKILKRVEHDLYYIENWSVGLDIRILIRTVGVLFNHKNAY